MRPRQRIRLIIQKILLTSVAAFDRVILLKSFKIECGKEKALTFLSRSFPDILEL